MDVFEIKGCRDYMEDTHYCLNSRDYAVVAVFDGHGGDQVAKAAAKYMEKGFNYHTERLHSVKRAVLYQKELIKMDGVVGPASAEAGATAVIVVFLKKERLVYILNLGDSRAYMFVSGQLDLIDAYGKRKTLKPVQKRFATILHTIRHDVKRVVAMGGFVQEDRVNGVLALSRSLGDFNVRATKQPKVKGKLVSNVPDVYIVPSKQLVSPILVATDGLEEGINVTDIFKLLQQSASAKDLVNQSYSQGSEDNITVVKFLCK